MILDYEFEADLFVRSICRQRLKLGRCPVCGKDTGGDFCRACGRAEKRPASWKGSKLPERQGFK